MMVHACVNVESPPTHSSVVVLAEVTSKIIYFRYQKKYLLPQSIQK